MKMKHELIGDYQLFKEIVEGFFRDYKGAFDILTFDDKEYIFNPYDSHSPYCKAIRSKDWGEKLCKENDIKYSFEALKSGKAIGYKCHAGLNDFAAPIIVNGECVATIFCGQKRDNCKTKQTNTEVEKIYKEHGVFLKDEFFSTNTLQIGESEKIIDQLNKLSKYLSKSWEDKLELLQVKNKLELTIKEKDDIGIAFNQLSSNYKNEKIFFEDLHKLIVNICNILNACCGLICFNSTVDGEKLICHQIEDFAWYKSSKSIEVSVDPLFEELFQLNQPKVIDIKNNDHSKFLENVMKAHNNLKNVLCWPLELNSHTTGIFILFFDNEGDLQNSLDSNDELMLITPFINQITSAYKNLYLNIKTEEMRTLRNKWVLEVIHESVQPIDGILGYTEIWRKRVEDHLIFDYREWTQIDFKNLMFALENIEYMAGNSVRALKNMAYLANENDFKKEFATFRIIENITGLFIAAARDKQAHARERGVYGPTIKKETFSPFEKINGDEELLKQVIGNLFDNAIKYSEKGTEIIVISAIDRGKIKIFVQNFGFPVLPGEEDKIFEKGYRSDSALESPITGHGIGLSVAKKIMKIHRGDIKVEPSVKVVLNNGKNTHKTVFEIIFPSVK